MEHNENNETEWTIMKNPEKWCNIIKHYET